MDLDVASGVLGVQQAQGCWLINALATLNLQLPDFLAKKCIGIVLLLLLLLYML